MRYGLSPRTTNMPGEAYIAATMRRRVCGFASAGFATSPCTRPMSTPPASSSGTFSVLPFVLRGSMRRVGSFAFTTSAKAAP